MSDEPEPVRLPPSILRGSRTAHPRGAAAAQSAPPAPAGRPASASRPRLAPQFVVGRRTDNELILFDEAGQESWILYPPRSAYDFLATRRPSPEVAVIEHHPWQPYARPDDHPVEPRAACRSHGTACTAGVVVQTAVRLGYDPFA